VKKLFSLVLVVALLVTLVLPGQGVGLGAASPGARNIADLIRSETQSLVAVTVSGRTYNIVTLGRRISPTALVAEANSQPGAIVFTDSTGSPVRNEDTLRRLATILWARTERVSRANIATGTASFIELYENRMYLHGKLQVFDLASDLLAGATGAALAGFFTGGLSLKTEALTALTEVTDVVTDPKSILIPFISDDFNEAVTRLRAAHVIEQSEIVDFETARRYLTLIFEATRIASAAGGALAYIDDITRTVADLALAFVGDIGSSIWDRTVTALAKARQARSKFTTIVRVADSALDIKEDIEETAKKAAMALNAMRGKYPWVATYFIERAEARTRFERDGLFMPRQSPEIEYTRSLAAATLEPVSPTVSILHVSRAQAQAQEGQPVVLSMRLRNTGSVQWTFHGAVTLRRPNGTQVHLPLQPATLGEAREGTITWTFTPDLPGSWSAVFGVWREAERRASLAQTGWMANYLTVVSSPSIALRPIITTTALPNTSVGESYTATLTASGGTAPYTWTATNLTPGLLLSGGTISGMPTTAGAYAMAVQVQDSRGQTALQHFIVAVVAASAARVPTITALPDGVVGVGYTATLVASGGVGPHTWSVSAGHLPPGLSLRGNIISGTPTAHGATPFVVSARDSQGQAFNVNQWLSIAVVAPTTVHVPTITSTTLPQSTVGVAFSATLTASGGTAPYTWTATGLPAGLSLSGNIISGAPTIAGTHAIVVRVQDSRGQSAEQSLTIVVAPPAASVPLAITTVALPGGTVGVSYTSVLTARGGVAPYTWTVTGLPTGLRLSGNTISGKPTAVGTHALTLRVQDSRGQSVQQVLSLRVGALAAVQPLAITTTALPSGTVGANYSTALMVVGGVAPHTWTAIGLPLGIMLSGNTIFGKPHTAGAHAVTVQVQDSRGLSVAQQFIVAVAASSASPMPTITALPSATVGLGYSATLTASGGTPPHTWSLIVGRLPAGLTLTGNTISGTPTVQGPMLFVLSALDSRGQAFNTNQWFSISVGLPTSAPPAGQVPPPVDTETTIHTIEGNMVSVGQVDRHTITPQRSGIHRFRVVRAASGVGVSLTVVNPEGRELSPLFWAQLAGDGVQFSLQSGRTYTVRVTQHSGLGPFTLQIARPSAPVDIFGLTEIAASTEQSADLTYTITPQRSGIHRFRVVRAASGVGVSLTVVNPEGRELSPLFWAQLAGDGVQFSLQSGRTYTVRVTQHSGLGPFTLQIARPSAPVDIFGLTEIAASTEQSADLTYTITPQRSGIHRFRVVRAASGVGVSLTVVNPEGRELSPLFWAQLAGDGVQFSLQSGRTYTVRVTQHSGVGPFTLQIVQP